MKWIYVLLIVPVLSIALAPGVAGTQATNSISSPSGNIHCKAYGARTVACTTTVPFRSALLVVGRRAIRTLARHLPAGQVLVYGDAWGSTLTPPAFFQCASEQTGMVCTDYGVHGFTISSRRLDTW